MTDTYARALCTSCGSTPTGCASLRVIGGRDCCRTCTHPPTAHSSTSAAVTGGAR